MVPQMDLKMILVIIHFGSHITMVLWLWLFFITRDMRKLIIRGDSYRVRRPSHGLVLPGKQEASRVDRTDKPEPVLTEVWVLGLD